MRSTRLASPSLAAALAALLALAANPYLLALVLPALHVWLCLPALARRGVVARLGVVALGLAGPAALLALLATSGGLGSAAPAWLLRLAGDGTLPLPASLAAALLLAAGAQLAAIVAGRYAAPVEPAAR
jgi:hypothetical protein